ncbi:putative gpi-anchored wall transfer protein [Diaporthe ampelina]|uniref:GPI-anchored wall transfer protein n=1 Tax=Diaporthe ampelina TaxID=1214573 RepID=A0A0G2IFX2_9PEZI|nr:putative gpi-anchored wall transfer protein [Diaporthe ampelina]
MSNSTASYKQLKEDFVSNLTGGPVSEIAAVTAVLPVGALVWSALQSRQSFFRPYTFVGFIIDYFLNVGAVLLAITLYSDTPILLIVLLLAPALLVYAFPPNLVARRKKPKIPPTAQASKTKGSAAGLDTLSTKPFLTVFRGSMLVITCLAILAVDFRIFPRRFGKVETWGTSLMDIGVGAFVFSAGVVAARPVLKERAEGHGAPLFRRLVYSMRHSLPLLVLGVIRLLSVKGLDYAEHVTEYGVHWNFFFTLGFLPPFVAVFQSALKLIPSYAALALILGVGYQVLLESTGLKAYILTAPRVDLLSMNREGIFSFFGYLAIFLAGQDTGILANLPYVLGVVSFNSVQLMACCLVETVFFPSFYNAADIKAEKEAYEVATPRVLRAYNRNGLAVFLIANLMTGLVNMTVPTLDIGPVASVGILVAYSAVLTGVAVVLDAYNISIKL